MAVQTCPHCGKMSARRGFLKHHDCRIFEAMECTQRTIKKTQAQYAKHIESCIALDQ